MIRRVGGRPISSSAFFAEHQDSANDGGTYADEERSGDPRTPSERDVQCPVRALPMAIHSKSAVGNVFVVRSRRAPVSAQLRVCEVSSALGSHGGAKSKRGRSNSALSGAQKYTAGRSRGSFSTPIYFRSGALGAERIFATASRIRIIHYSREDV